MSESTHGGETEGPGTSARQRRTMSMNAAKNVLMAVEAQGVHEAEGHGVGTPAEAALGRVELWNVGRNAHHRA